MLVKIKEDVIIINKREKGNVIQPGGMQTADGA